MELDKTVDCIKIDDWFCGYSKELFCIPDHYMESVTTVLIPHGIIQERIRKIARDILGDILEDSQHCFE